MVNRGFAKGLGDAKLTARLRAAYEPLTSRVRFARAGVTCPYIYQELLQNTYFSLDVC
jgi:hypothetical protein